MPTVPVRSCRLLALVVALGACDQVQTVGVEEPRAGDPILGQAAFQRTCASCHSSRDGIDLARFSFPDSTIVRRALQHVDSSTALDIVAHIRSLAVAPEPRGVRVFQPGGRVLSGDVEFAERLFGFDGFPGGMTTPRMRAIDLRHVAIALPFGAWSSEASNTDWMPEAPIADAILDYRDGWARGALDDYYAGPSDAHLITAVSRLRSAERSTDNPDAPCIASPNTLLRAGPCFETRRWIATLAAQHMLRSGVQGPLHPALHDAWWDVGQAVRIALLRDQSFENGVEIWTSWMWLGWSFEPGRHASVYLASGLQRLGLYRHATFHALKAMVERDAGLLDPYLDVRQAATYAPAHWTYEGVAFAYRHLLERIEGGDLPPANKSADARVALEAAQSAAAKRLTAGEAAALQTLLDQVLSRLP
ncbi:MAG: hypothetical protein R3E10_06025 [Gemmatimonadota bacterium]